MSALIQKIKNAKTFCALFAPRRAYMSYHFRDRTRCKKIKIALEESSCGEDEDYEPSCTSDDSEDTQNSARDESSENAEDESEADEEEEPEADSDMDSSKDEKD